MGDTVPSSSNNVKSVYNLLAFLAGEGCSEQDAVEHIRVLVEVSRSPFISKDVKRAIGFVQSFTFSLLDLTPEQRQDVAATVAARKKEIADEV
jgi:hypothetical protein